MLGVRAEHSAYRKTRDQWQRCRDAVAGSDAVKARGTTYLPQLSEQSAAEYEAYKLRTLWYGATARTLQGLVGAITRKLPTATVPSKLEGIVHDVTQTGIPLDAFAKSVLCEVLEVGRCGVLVDMPKASDTPRPYLVLYHAEQIVNWRTSAINGVPVLELLVVKECVEQPQAGDRFATDLVEQYRVMQLDEQGHYVVDIYRQTNGAWQVKETITPTFRGTSLDYIPFCFFGPSSLTAEVEKPPLLDLIDVNFSHYRSSADLEHGRHYCGLPTPWVAGFPEKTTLKIGSSIAWVATDPAAKAGMLEFTGQGLSALVTACESKEKLMAVLGARLLEEQKKTVEASDTLTTRLSGEQSVLRSVANSVSIGLSKLLEWSALWLGVSPDEARKATVKLNTDFIETQMSFAELESLVRSWQAGAMSYETMYHNMQRGELTRPGVEWEEEKTQIETETPTLTPQEDL